MKQKRERSRELDAGVRAALISLYLYRDETLIFWVDGASSGVQVERAAVGNNEIATAAKKLHELFSPNRINFRRPEYTTDMAWLEPIGKKLLQPLKDRLSEYDALVVAPHAELHLIPLHLLAPKGCQPLAVTHSVTYVANLSLYALLINRGGDGPADLDLPSLCLSTAAVEDSAIVHADFAATPSLLAQRTGGIFLQDKNATWLAFRHYADSAKILYLSCHGCFDEKDPLDSVLLLSDGCTLPSRIPSQNTGLHRLSVRDILEMRVNSSLVILDACMSGSQRFSPGDEPMGFPTAFLLSGAGAVIASNWVVERNCASDFVTALVGCWSSGSLTLGQAMREAYSHTKASYPHPFHWGAFSLFGNDRMVFI